MMNNHHYSIVFHCVILFYKFFYTFRLKNPILPFAFFLSRRYSSKLFRFQNLQMCWKCLTSAKEMERLTFRFPRQQNLKFSSEQLRSISPTFYEHVCVNILAPKKFKPKMWVQKSLAQNLRTKKACIKCWWNWHQAGILLWE